MEMTKAERSLQAFTKRMNALGATPLQKVFTPHGEVLLAERQFVYEGVPYFETFWMVHRNGIDLGRSVRTPAYTTHVGSIELPVPMLSSQQDRINEALNDALSFIQLNVKYRRYD